MKIVKKANFGIFRLITPWRIKRKFSNKYVGSACPSHISDTAFLLEVVKMRKMGCQLRTTGSNIRSAYSPMSSRLQSCYNTPKFWLTLSRRIHKSDIWTRCLKLTAHFPHFYHLKQKSRFWNVTGAGIPNHIQHARTYLGWELETVNINQAPCLVEWGGRFFNFQKT